MIRVLLAEDMHLVRGALVALLEREDDLAVVAEVGDGTGFVAAVREHRPDVAVLDVGMPGVDGVEAAGRIAREAPGCRVLMVTVLREAVTNVLRHSAARRCLLEASRGGDRVRLRVVNDGTGDVPPGPPGQGVANLTARVGALGGTLRVRHLPDGAFELALLQPVGVGRDPDGVEPVARP
ncbi:response regulator [Actinomadura sp. LOL_016]|uniref:response regulator n=1 Tax=unclassified Actinomadura TaxID=2626254 RepID=UPI003A8039C9